MGDVLGTILGVALLGLIGWGGWFLLKWSAALALHTTYFLFGKERVQTKQTQLIKRWKEAK